MVEYRRGIAKQRKNSLWHWHADCESYPAKTFAIRQDRPSDDDLCGRCQTLAQDVRTRSAA